MSLRAMVASLCVFLFTLLNRHFDTLLPELLQPNWVSYSVAPLMRRYLTENSLPHSKWLLNSILEVVNPEDIQQVGTIALRAVYSLSSGTYKHTDKS